MRRFVVALAFVLMAAKAAHAQPDANDAAFRSGLEQYNRGNYADAISTWETLITTLGETSGFKVLYNLGLAYQETGNVTKAIERYRVFLAQCEARPAAEQATLAARMTDTRKRLGDLESAHGRVIVHPPKKGPLVLTSVNGGEPRTAGYTVWLAPGKHTIELFVGTDHVKKIEVVVTKGGEREIDTTPADITAPQPASAKPAIVTTTNNKSDDGGGGRSTARTVGLIGAGVSIASVALPISLYFVAKAKGDDARDLGGGHSGYVAASDDYDSARTLYLASYAVPIALGAATVILYFALSPSSSSNKTTAMRRRGAGFVF